MLISTDPFSLQLFNDLYEKLQGSPHNENAPISVIVYIYVFFDEVDIVTNVLQDHVYVLLLHQQIHLFFTVEFGYETTQKLTASLDDLNIFSRQIDVPKLVETNKLRIN